MRGPPDSRCNIEECLAEHQGRQFLSSLAPAGKKSYSRQASGLLSRITNYTYCSGCVISREF